MSSACYLCHITKQVLWCAHSEFFFFVVNYQNFSWGSFPSISNFCCSSVPSSEVCIFLPHSIPSSVYWWTGEGIEISFCFESILSWFRGFHKVCSFSSKSWHRNFTQGVFSQFDSCYWEVSMFEASWTGLKCSRIWTKAIATIGDKENSKLYCRRFNAVVLPAT